MWMQNGKAFVWIEHADGNVDLIGESPALLHPMMENMGIALIQLPGNITFLPGDVLAGTLSPPDDDGGLGEGPWIA